LLPLHESPHLAAALAARQIVMATPIQEAAVGFVHRGTSLTLHSETGSGKTLALLAPLLLRLRGRAALDNRRVLVLAPSRELAAQLAAEAKQLLGPGEGSVKLVCLGEKYVPTVQSLAGAAVLVATPAELAAALWADSDLRAWLPEHLGAMVLDEVDALIPSRKFTGSRILYMDEGMHPAEGIVKLVARRCVGPDFQV
jgi:superfamily II DNA/RNA helicase